MIKVKNLGFAIFILGIVLLITYGAYLGFSDFLGVLDIITGLSIIMIMIGLIVLFISILIEQQHGKEKIKEELKKEDLEP
jgi:hypothetical protein